MDFQPPIQAPRIASEEPREMVVHYTDKKGARRIKGGRRLKSSQAYTIQTLGIQPSKLGDIQRNKEHPNSKHRLFEPSYSRQGLGGLWRACERAIEVESCVMPDAF